MTEEVKAEFTAPCLQSSYLQASWERSSAYGVDPLENRDAAMLDAGMLRQHRQELQTLLQQMEPSLMRLYTWIRHTQSSVIVADTNGYILESIGDPVFLNAADRIHLMKGACWTEQRKGTNAIGTALVEQKPIAVVGQEHFCVQNQFLCCAAAPIFDKAGALTAVLDISGYHEQYHPSILAMVDVVARNIEDWMIIGDEDCRLIISLSPGANDHGRHQALLAVNEDGVLVGANREAHTALGIQESLGRPVLLSDLLMGCQPLLTRASRSQAQEVSVRGLSGRGPRDEAAKWRAEVFLDRRDLVVGFALPARARTEAHKPGSQAASSQVGSPQSTGSQPASSQDGSPRPSGSQSAWPTRYSFSDICAADANFHAALQLARRAAMTDYNVLIAGETGTGKEMVGQAMHRASPRGTRPFIAINCSVVSKSLLESELFGYEAGSFTGAKASGQPGKIELAHGGTLFLDEIAEMPSDMQAALLRVLQERMIVRVGGTKPIPVDIRIIGATHKDLWQETQTGHFRLDLFFRLQGIQIALPPLRTRTDLVELTSYFLAVIGAELQKRPLTLAPDAHRLLQHYDWPGNVRELETVLRQAAFLALDNTLRAQHFPVRMTAANTTKPPSDPSVQPYSHTQGERRQRLRQIEIQAVLEAMRETDGNVSQAAKLLGIGRNTLYRKLKKT
ncbi:MAG: sigma-54-dependent Fis family transcriptional regulator [Bacilli bacterium]